MNSVVLSGRLGQDAESGYTDSGTPYVRFSIAVQRNKEQVDWFPVSYLNASAEKISGWLLKGRMVGVVGSLETFKRKDESTGFSVRAHRVEFLDSKKAESEKESETEEAVPA